MLIVTCKMHWGIHWTPISQSHWTDPGCILIELEGAFSLSFSLKTVTIQPPPPADDGDIWESWGDDCKYHYGQVQRCNFDQNEKEASVTHHSKKLAIAFSLIKLRLGATIQLSKNLRVCLDCHSTTKVYNREIVVRGMNISQSLQIWFLLLQWANDYWWVAILILSAELSFI